MHGWAGSGAYFDETLKCLDLVQARAITFDFRGHGDSGQTDDGFTLDRLDDDVLAVASEAGAETFVVVGFSMSGKFAQHVSCTDPERVLGQILVAGMPVGEFPLPPEVLADWYGRAGDAARMIDLVTMFAKRPIAGEVLARFGRDAAKVPLAALQGTMEMATSTSFVDKLATAGVPAVVVGGLHDEIFTPDQLRDNVVRPLRNARLELLDCGHEIPIEMPQELAAMIAAFVAEVA
jgi:pimeloyl-ACP methyl ester carboxylesterase